MGWAVHCHSIQYHSRSMPWLGGRNEPIHLRSIWPVDHRHIPRILPALGARVASRQQPAHQQSEQRQLHLLADRYRKRSDHTAGDGTDAAGCDVSAGPVIDWARADIASSSICPVPGCVVAPLPVTVSEKMKLPLF